MSDVVVNSVDDLNRKPLAAIRMIVLLAGVFGGAALMAIASLTQLPQSVGFGYRFECWTIMMGGPIVGTETALLPSTVFSTLVGSDFRWLLRV